MANAATRTLTVASRGGLANRLRALVSAMALAEATDRTFTMVWPYTEHMGARFDELFTNEWPIEYVDELTGDWQRPAPQGAGLTTSPIDHLRLQHDGWFGDRRSPETSDIFHRAIELFGELELQPALAEQVEEMATGFGAVTIGAHVRRGDFITDHRGVVANLDQVVQLVHEKIAEYDATAVFLATDDGASLTNTGDDGPTEGVRDRFRAEFGDRLTMTSPRSLDRRSLDAIEDAVIDLYLLRRCRTVIGTSGSSFAELALVDRHKDLIRCGQERWWRAAHVLHLTGADRLVARYHARRFGVEHTGPGAVQLLFRRIDSRIDAVRGFRR